MLRTYLLVCLSFIVLFTTSVKAQEWAHYVPEKNRSDIIKHVKRDSGFARMMATNFRVTVYWLTEPLADVLVSSAVDKERLSENEANERYQKYRNIGQYVFLIKVQETQGRHIRGNVSDVVNPLQSGEVFLQRADDHKVFARGVIQNSSYDFRLEDGGMSNYYLLTFPKVSKDGQSLIHSLDDKVELQISMPEKPVIFEYRIKDLVVRLEDL